MLSVTLFRTSRTSRTNTNRTDHCSVRVRLEQNFLEPLLRSAAFKQCLCSVRGRIEQTEQTRTCTVRQAISVVLEASTLRMMAGAPRGKVDRDEDLSFC